MTISIENYVEKCIWNEWSNRIKSINNHYIRKHFYPNNIEFLSPLVGLGPGRGYALLFFIVGPGAIPFTRIFGARLIALVFVNV